MQEKRGVIEYVIVEDVWRKGEMILPVLEKSEELAELILPQLDGYTIYQIRQAMQIIDKVIMETTPVSPVISKIGE